MLFDDEDPEGKPCGGARTIQGIETVNMIRNGQGRWLPQGDIACQVAFLASCSGLTAAASSESKSRSLFSPFHVLQQHYQSLYFTRAAATRLPIV